MGLLDDVGKAVGGQLGSALAGGGGQGGLVQVVIQWLGSGGLAQLTSGFQKAGLGNVAASWIGTGANLPVSPEQLAGALGTAQLGALAKQAGLAPQVAAGQLATLLPALVDELTPDGVVPQGGALEQGLGLLKKLF
jgi:uncharacterized protein YidB (DUF937 family)